MRRTRNLKLLKFSAAVPPVPSGTSSNLLFPVVHYQLLVVVYVDSESVRVVILVMTVT